MNYDIDTPDGMRNAVAWLNFMLSACVTDTLVWYIPRSDSCYTISRSGKTYTSEGVDSPTERVLAQAGFTKAVLQ